MSECLVLFLSSLFLVLALSPSFRRLAQRLGIVDVPAGLKEHPRPTPYLGGLAIYLAFATPVLVWAAVRSSLPLPLLGLLAGGTVVCGLGLFDDVKELSPQVKIFGTLAAATILVLCGVRLRIIFLPVWLNLALTFIWIVGITHAFNIIDVLDGLSAGVAFIAASTFFLIAVPTENLLVAISSAALAGSSLGFLRFNFHPAKIFMGDAGSLFLGFILAGVSIAESYTAVNDVAIFSPLLILAVPIYDTFYVSTLRMVRRRSPLRGSRDHFALKLKAIGLKDQHVVLTIYLISIVLCEASHIVTTVSMFGALFTYGVVAFVLIVVGGGLSRVTPGKARSGR